MAKRKTRTLKIKRIYEEAHPSDGCRVLVDGIWPRGVAKQDARLDLWLKEIAPSAGLRKWFGHAPGRWEGFKKRYFEELDANADAVARLEAAMEKGPVTLLYAAREERFNNAVALREYLSKHGSA